MFFLLLILALVLPGCTLAHVLNPVEPPWFVIPHPSNPNHFLSPIKPVMTAHVDGKVFRYVEWHGSEKFQSFSIQPTGTAKEGEPKRRCFHFYGGVKIDEIVDIDNDGTVYRHRSPTDPVIGDRWYSYVYTPDEQHAARWHWCGYPHLMDMGGS